MTWSPVTTAPAGWAPGVLRDGDTLASLEAETRISAQDIASANGVPYPGRKTCTWANDLDEWVLGTGGRRIPSSANTCDPRGYTAFVGGQVIYLPPGTRPAPTILSAPSSSSSSKGLLYALGALAALAALAAASR